MAACCAVLIAAAGAPTAAAQTRVTLKSAATNTAYYHMTVQIAEALKSATQGQIQATVEESQGSVQNVKEAAKRPGAFIFTSPPGLVQSAVAGKKPFEGESGYDAIRALFVMPAITMHWVVRADAGVRSFADLAGKDFVAGGRGTFSERQTIAVFKLLGLEGKVKLVEVELAAAFNAVRNRQVSGF
ncbi:MAG: TAXI family TRAP transporter solute-binding subunit, partial [Alphaproteobacteria bacterium]|nr:TAXI family TRAP transporter solute-binding subunit [Alphaproteobacteria bacterium]